MDSKTAIELLKVYPFTISNLKTGDEYGSKNIIDLIETISRQAKIGEAAEKAFDVTACCWKCNRVHDSEDCKYIHGEITCEWADFCRLRAELKEDKHND